jgi:hypothetical protein
VVMMMMIQKIGSAVYIRDLLNTTKLSTKILHEHWQKIGEASS